ncbi:hypothetical protein PSEUDO8AS_50067 [Pseudomonas sp. 8AS]|nr:hypothetical protein PSEUDO8AS_50067 [Pseudomonas sp. 8AS]
MMPALSDRTMCAPFRLVRVHLTPVPPFALNGRDWVDEEELCSQPQQSKKNRPCTCQRP